MPCWVKKKRVVSQFEDLQQCYLRLRGRQSEAAAEPPSGAELPASPSTAAEPQAQAQQPQQQDDARVPKRQRGRPSSGDLAAEASQEPVSQGLTEFSRILSVFTHCSRLRVRPARLLNR